MVAAASQMARAGRSALAGAGSVAARATEAHVAAAWLTGDGVAVAAAVRIPFGILGAASLQGTGTVVAASHVLYALLGASSLQGSGGFVAAGMLVAGRLIDVAGRADTVLDVTGQADVLIEVGGDPDMAVKANVEFFKGEDVVIVVTMPDGTDIATWTLEASVKSDAGDPDPPLLSKTSSPAGGISKISSTKFQIDIGSADTDDWQATVYAWAAKRTSPGAQAVLVCGNLNLKENA